MAKPVIIPQLDLTTEEVTIAEWLKKAGDWVQEGEPILTMETAKAIVEVAAPATGILAGITALEGAIVPVGQVVGYILVPGESLEAVQATATPATQGSAPAPQSAPGPAVPTEGAKSEPGVRASPAARRMAKERGLDIAQVPGSGPGGAVTEDDVGASVARAQQAQSPKGTELTGVRKVIAERMAKSFREAPHIFLTMEADMAQAETCRGDCSLTAVVVWAAAQALRRHPLANAHFIDGRVVAQEDVNVGTAVAAAGGGLYVPVVRAADGKLLPEIDSEIRQLAQKARQGRLSLDEMKDGSFTVTNLGMHGVDEFHAVINPPEVAILAVGRVARKPVVLGDKIEIRPMMRLSLSADHRVVNGMEAAELLGEIKELLEHPPG